MDKARAKRWAGLALAYLLGAASTIVAVFLVALQDSTHSVRAVDRAILDTAPVTIVPDTPDDTLVYQPGGARISRDAVLALKIVRKDPRYRDLFVHGDTPSVQQAHVDPSDAAALRREQLASGVRGPMRITASDSAPSIFTSMDVDVELVRDSATRLPAAAPKGGVAASKRGVLITDLMRVVLRPGPFTIDSSGEPLTKVVAQGDTTVWHFQVTPRETGPVRIVAVAFNMLGNAKDEFHPAIADSLPLTVRASPARQAEHLIVDHYGITLSVLGTLGIGTWFKDQLRGLVALILARLFPRAAKPSTGQPPGPPPES